MSDAKVGQDLLGKWVHKKGVYIDSDEWVKVFTVTCNIDTTPYINAIDSTLFDLSDVRDEKPNAMPENYYGKWARIINTQGTDRVAMGEWVKLGKQSSRIYKTVEIQNRNIVLFPWRMDLTDLRDEKPLTRGDLINKWVKCVKHCGNSLIDNVWYPVVSVGTHKGEVDSINGYFPSRFDLTDIRDEKPLTTEDVKGKWVKCIDDFATNIFVKDEWYQLSRITKNWVYFNDKGGWRQDRFDLTDLRDEKPLDIDARTKMIEESLKEVKDIFQYTGISPLKSIAEVLAKDPRAPVIQFLRP